MVMRNCFHSAVLVLSALAVLTLISASPVLGATQDASSHHYGIGSRTVTEPDPGIGTLPPPDIEPEIRIGTLPPPDIEPETRIGTLPPPDIEPETRIGTLPPPDIEPETRIGTLPPPDIEPEG
jgi:hypothetical protein